ncbi:PAS domain S-box protein [Methanoregula sp.]|uniref:PAS domain S-box protein n=1 Tax=Methanoregula sp. TaxID=2052170 RepID=UPI00236E0B55|nr:PAS domain S-box protein [Methanoregula sp.]MDD1687728.1 PAS domain S-box protein [Methanoregula sp.]
MSTITALYVDDEPDLLEIARIFLEKTGDLTIDTCSSPLDAMEKLRSVRYDAIISDYQMPEMDGITFLKTVRSNVGPIPFILFTGRGREEVVIQAINHGADFYLQKGGDPKAQFAELAHKIRQAVQQKRAEASIHDHERRESDIINFLPDATFAIDMSGHIIAWNRAMERMTGVNAPAVMGKGDYEYAIPFYHERRPILIDLVLRNDPADPHYPFIKRDGKTLFSEITIPHFNNGTGAALWFTASPLYDMQGTVVGAIESIRDITDQKRIEEALRESKEKFREMADLLPQIVYEADCHGLLTYANAIAFQLFGYTREDFSRGLHIPDMIVPEERERGVRAMRDILAGKPLPAGGQEYQALRKDGSTFPVTIYTVPIVRNDRITGLRGIIVDISSRQQVEEQLRERERFLTTLMSHLPGFVYRCRNDRDWTMTYISEGCRDLTGYAPADFLVDRTITFNALIHPDHRERIWQKWQTLLGRLEVFEDEYPIITKSGETRWVQERGQGIFSEDHRLLFLEGFIADVTRRRSVEEALEKKSRYYELLLHTSTDAIHVMDKDGRLREWNDAFLSHLGYSAQEAAHLTIADWDVSRKIDQFALWIAGLIREGGIIEAIHRRKDGTLRDMEITTTAVTIDGEKLLYASARDITERKRVNRALFESEARYRNIVESFEDLYYETDAKGIIRFLSPSCYPLTGWTVAELTGKPVTTVYSDEKYRNDLTVAIQETGYVRDFEIVLNKRDGTPTPVSLSAHIIRNPGGYLAGIAGSLRDITDRKRAEVEIQRSREQLALVIAGSGAGFWDWNIPEGRLIINERWAEIIGHSLADLEPISVKTWEKYCHPDDLRRSEILQQQHFTGENPVYESEARMLHADGHWVWVLDRGKVVEWDHEHRPVRMTGTHIDITRIKQMESALRQANTKLNLLNSITRHDIVNQLTSLKGFLELSRMNPADTASVAGFIDKEESIAKTIERQIAFTRYYQDMGVKDPAWQNVEASALGAAAALPMRGISLCIERSDLEVYADPLFDKVFYNLIDNALRYGGDRMTAVRISCQEIADGLVLVCEDDGAGISDENRKRLFERGFGKNTGLGLFLVREILSITGITIRETGTPGIGARFELLVPRGSYRFARL